MLGLGLGLGFGLGIGLGFGLGLGLGLGLGFGIRGGLGFGIVSGMMANTRLWFYGYLIYSDLDKIVRTEVRMLFIDCIVG